MGAAGVVFRKELLEGARDRRALVAVFISISIFPILVLFMGRFAEGVRDEVRQMEIPVVGGEHAPDLTDWLSRQPGVEVVAGPEEPMRVWVQDYNSAV